MTRSETQLVGVDERWSTKQTRSRADPERRIIGYWASPLKGKGTKLSNKCIIAYIICMLLENTYHHGLDLFRKF